MLNACMDLRCMCYLLSMSDLRLARVRMKSVNEKGKLEELLFIAVCAVFGVLRACLESDDSSVFVFLGFLAVFMLFLALIEKFTKRYKKEIEERPDGNPLYPEKVSAVKEEMRNIYGAAAFTFVLLVLFSIWAEYYPHGTFSFLNQYSEHFFLGGTAVIFLLVVLVRRR